MAKKRKAPRQSGGPKEFKESDAKIGLIKTYEDVADEEDDFHINRDKVLLGEGPEAKRRRKWAEEGMLCVNSLSNYALIFIDAFLQPSDEEILPVDDSSSEEEEEEEEEDIPAKKSKPKKNAASESEEEEEDEEDEDAGGWGSSRKDYYNADQIETEADALEEEAEAKRLQQKRLQKMSEADFGFDENEWKQAVDDQDEGDVVTEVLKDVEITEDMGPEERSRLLQTRYPEFEFLANEFVELHPLLEELNYEIKTTPSTQQAVPKMKSRALAAYIGALTMYFAVLTSTAKDGDAKSALDPMELRDHGVMDSLLQCREMWSQVKSLKAIDLSAEDVEMVYSEEDILESDEEMQTISIPSTRKSKQAAIREEAAATAAKARKARIDATEADLADLSTLIPKATKTKKIARKSAQTQQDSDSDFGEEETLSTRAAAEKAAKKKSLRFYTSQIAQKANRRADAGRDAGGDADLPYRERLRDRQARLNVEAEKRGKKLDEYGRGTALGGDDSGDEDGADRAAADEIRGEEDEYYDMVAQTSKAKKAVKEDKYAAIVAAKEQNALIREVEGEVGDDGKRAIGYVIQKNKGLAPKRKKEVRNPRVKKRMKYEEKKKKLSSMRAVYKGGEERGGYGGEKTGIKAGLVKSIKL
jgi:U3 small nucleolar RNA-associated protein 3